MSNPTDPNLEQAAAPQYAAPPADAQYAAPQQYAAAPAAPTNTMAVISMISSIVGFFSAGLLSVLGVILGHVSLKQLKTSGEGGRGMAVAGLIIGYVGIALYVVVAFAVIAFLLIAVAASSS